MRSLAIDVGNTYIKAGLFKGHDLLKVYPPLRAAALPELLAHTQFQAGMISSVAALPEELSQALSQHGILRLDASTRLPFTNEYATPQTLGSDRVAAVAGAALLYPHRDLLVVDMGTCTTYDFIDRQGRYQGGAIAPGLQMRLRAMHTFTARLPLVSTEHIAAQDIALTGKDTPTSMLSGAVIGMAAEITQMIRMYADKYPDLQVVSCGGDATYCAPLIRQPHVIIPELILIGLNSILLYHVA